MYKEVGKMYKEVGNKLTDLIFNIFEKLFILDGTNNFVTFVSTKDIWQRLNLKPLMLEERSLVLMSQQ